MSDIARRHDVTRWQVYDWCKKLTTGGLALPGEATREPLFAALVVEPPASSASRARHISSEKAKPLPVELVVDGAILRVRSGIDEVCLTGMIRAIRAASR